MAKTNARVEKRKFHKANQKRKVEFKERAEESAIRMEAWAELESDQWTPERRKVNGVATDTDIATLMKAADDIRYQIENGLPSLTQKAALDLRRDLTSPRMKRRIKWLEKHLAIPEIPSVK